ncbi:hypothetical protein ACXO7I_05455 [Lactobacillus delbrueckii subsp. bulgaricus]|nr:hypothetical protein [Lactobacillus delbrueckii subsp. bulgaricus]MBT9005922.1 hypothetical protein [Lactobacillus delbrueckii subsp. bulgaricus]MBT9007634.1 hypothetical protein [Lactobacillus delbrueckii subsp. bulgaricus]MBT9014048.1 hypothetical protein [Lactobacillus delbrueckii subsp. bulgaricus]MBT9054896.1 hypothetical protein [Lactobacillus delbrueckii subsp. bulgaricus]
MKKRYYPYIYGGIAGVMTFIAMFYICRHSFALTNTQSLVWGIIGAILVFVSSSYTEYAIAEIQRISDKYNLDEEFLSGLTKLSPSYFRVADDHLHLTAPRYLWPRILKALQKYDHERKQAENFHL